MSARALAAEADAARLRAHIDAAGDGANLPALLDLYHDRAERAEAGLGGRLAHEQDAGRGGQGDAVGVVIAGGHWPSSGSSPAISCSGVSASGGSSAHARAASITASILTGRSRL